MKWAREEEMRVRTLFKLTQLKQRNLGIMSRSLVRRQYVEDIFLSVAFWLKWLANAVSVTQKNKLLITLSMSPWNQQNWGFKLTPFQGQMGTWKNLYMDGWMTTCWRIQSIFWHFGCRVATSGGCHYGKENRPLFLLVNLNSIRYQQWQRWVAI